jgi:toxin YoeB
MRYTLRFTPNALQDIERHKNSGDRKLLQKIEILLNELREHPTSGTGKPEMLKHDFKGLYSRIINRNHRLIYDIKQDIVTVIVVSLYSHYGDK